MDDGPATSYGARRGPSPIAGGARRALLGSAPVMKSDIEIAQEARLRPIEDVARAAGIDPADFIPYGRDKAKIAISAIARAEGKPEAPLVLVSAITPTPAGEGKSTTTVGLGQALNRLGKKAIIAL